MPAMLAIASIRPKVSTACCTIALASAKLETSPPLAAAFAAVAFDQRDDLAGGARILAIAPRGAAKVVDNNRWPFPGCKQGDLPADAMTTAGHQDNLAFESTTAGHRNSPFLRDLL